MAVDARGVRLEERLKIKVGEAKNLPARSHGTSHRDTYCVLSLDQEEIFRTSTVEKTLNPFFGEEFQFDVPRGFRYLSIYVFDRDRQYKQDKVLGKVAIKREELKNYDMDHWFALGPVDANSEVQGKANIEILFVKDSLPKITNLTLDDDPAVDGSNSGSARKPTLYDDFKDDCSNQSMDRKNSKSKNLSKNVNCKDGMKFGSCSSTSSRKLTSGSPLSDHQSISLSRSESLRSGPSSSIYNSTHSSYGITASRSMKISNSPDAQADANRQVHHYNSETCQSPRILSDYSGFSSIDSSYMPNEVSTSEGSYFAAKPKKLSIRVLECSDLTLKNGQCDPFAAVTVKYLSGKKVIKKTKAKKKTVNPKFDECFVFELTNENTSGKERENAYTICPISGDPIQEVIVSLWHDNFFLGEVRLPLNTSEQRSALDANAWYFLSSRHSTQNIQNNQNWLPGCESREQGGTSSGTQFSNLTPASRGSLRLLLHHTLDRVLPHSAYNDLQSLLLQQPHKPITSSAVYILGEIVPSKTDLAQPLVRLFTHADLLVPIIKVLADAELSTLTDQTTIFRGNTLVSKMMDEAMRLTGLSYLQKTLRETLQLVFLEKKPCEIDPTRVKDQGTIETNLTNLKEYIEKVFNAITASFVHCPAIMCRLFDALRQCAAQRFPRDAGVQYSVVSGFVFLRFFAPAILGPRLFDLTNEQIDPQTNRTLTLISKTIQSLGNIVSSRSSQPVCKEEYMLALYKHFHTPEHLETIKKFLEIISSSTETQNSNIQDTPVLLKEGIMIKRTQKRRRFFGQSLKKRYFQLTSCELSYSEARGKEAKCTIPLAEIVAAKQVPEVQSLKMKNMFQIVYRDRALYIQANNCVERKEWLDLLGKLCEGHGNEAQQYHSHSYSHGRWGCCHADKEDAPGCATVAAQSPTAGIHMRLDPTRDLQRIHCLLFNNIAILEKMENTKRENLMNNPSIEEFNSYQKTLNKIIKVTYCLEDQHRVYQRSLVKETKYGSKQAPIGDDNYLQLASRNTDSSKRNQPIKYSQSVIGMGHSNYQSPTSSSQRRMAGSMQIQSSPSSPPKSMSVFSKTSMAINHQSSLSSSFDSNKTDNLNLDLKPRLQIKGLKKDSPSSDTYLNNSLYIGSSTESIKTPAKVLCETSTERLSILNSSESGYLKMVSARNDFDASDSSSANQISNKNSLKMPSSLCSTSEYIHVKPILKEKDIKYVTNSIQDKSFNAENISRDSADVSLHSCQEYDLLSNFTSYSKNNTVLDAENDENQDIPPAIPPRSHHMVTPNLSKYHKKPPISSPNKDVQTRNVTDYEHKSMEHYQLKQSKSFSDNLKNKSTCSDQSEFICVDEKSNDDNSPCNTHEAPMKIASQESRSQISDMFHVTKKSEIDCNVSYSDTVNQVKSEKQTHLDKVQRNNDRVVPELEPSNIHSNITKSERATTPDYDSDVVLRSSTKEKEELGFFSRKNDQRKSTPTKSKLHNRKATSVDGAIQSIDSAQPMSSKSQPPLSNRLTPSFLKKKTKVNTDTVRLPPIC